MIKWLMGFFVHESKIDETRMEEAEVQARELRRISRELRVAMIDNRRAVKSVIDSVTERTQ